MGIEVIMNVITGALFATLATVMFSFVRFASLRWPYKHAWMHAGLMIGAYGTGILALRCVGYAIFGGYE